MRRPGLTEVSDLSRATWYVGRRWAPWRRRLRQPRGLNERDTARRRDDWVPGREANEVDAAIGAAVLLPVVALAVGIVLEWSAQAVAAPFVLLARAVGLVRWRVQVVQGRFALTELDGGSWRESGRRVQEVAAGIARNDLPERTISLPWFV